MINVLDSRKKSYFLSIFLLIFIPLTLYGKVISFDFVNWDDDRYVYENNSIRSFSQENIRAWFTKPFVSLYTPLTLVSYAIDYSVSENQPSAYHRTNLILHLINGFLLFFLLGSLFETPIACFLGALLFMVHPAQAESVAWISERKTLLFGFFSLAGLILWIKRKESTAKPVYLITVTAFFIGAILSKITAVTIPLVAASFNRFYPDKQGTIRQKWIAPLIVAMSLLFAMLTILLYPSIFSYLAKTSMTELFLNTTRCWLIYFKIALLPIKLSLFYPLGSAWVRSFPTTLLAIAVCVSFAGMLMWSWIKQQRWGFGLFLFFFMLLPVATFIPVPVSNRHLYLPLAGLIIAVLEVGRKNPRLLNIFLTCAIVGSLAITPNQINTWKNSRTLWTNALNDHPNNLIALSLMANTQIAAGEIAEAESSYQKIIELYPNEWKVYISLINLKLKNGETENAKKLIATTEKQFPKNNISLILKMAFLLNQNNFKEVILLQNQLNKNGYLSPVTDQYLAVAYFNESQYSQAAEHFEKAIRAGITTPEIIFQAAIANMNLKKWPESLNYLSKIESQNPEIPGLFFQMGYCFYQMNDLKSAADYYQKSMISQPLFPVAYDHFGLLLMTEKRAKEALPYFRKASELSPDSTIFKSHLQSAQNAATKN